MTSLDLHRYYSYHIHMSLSHTYESFDAFISFCKKVQNENGVSIKIILNKTYELCKGRKSSISYFHLFGYKCYTLNNKDNLGKFNAKSDELVEFIIMKKQVLEENIHVAFDEINDTLKKRNIANLKDELDKLKLI
ncbi:hypothetical protein CR513_51635, partial [Mucuna pruriens]